MKLPEILHGLASRTNFGGDEGARQDMLDAIAELDAPEPADDAPDPPALLSGLAAPQSAGDPVEPVPAEAKKR